MSVIRHVQCTIISIYLLRTSLIGENCVPLMLKHFYPYFYRSNIGHLFLIKLIARRAKINDLKLISFQLMNVIRATVINKKERIRRVILFERMVPKELVITAIMIKLSVVLWLF